MMQIKITTAAKVSKSKKDFFFYDTDKENKVSNYILTNDFKRKKQFNYFRIVSTIVNELEFITI